MDSVGKESLHPKFAFSSISWSDLAEEVLLCKLTNEERREKEKRTPPKNSLCSVNEEASLWSILTVSSQVSPSRRPLIVSLEILTMISWVRIKTLRFESETTVGPPKNSVIFWLITESSLSTDSLIDFSSFMAESEFFTEESPFITEFNHVATEGGRPR